MTASEIIRESREAIIDWMTEQKWIRFVEDTEGTQAFSSDHGGLCVCRGGDGAEMEITIRGKWMHLWICCLRSLNVEVWVFLIEIANRSAGIWSEAESAGASLIAQLVKNLSAMQETPVQSLDWEDLLENGMTTHSSILA